MRFSTFLVGLVVSAGLTLGTGSVQAAGEAEHVVEGRVIAVRHHKAGHGTITVEIRHHHLAPASATAAPGHHHHVTFEVNAATQIERGGQAVGFREVHDGEVVTIRARGRHAQVVDIHHPHSGPGAAAATAITKP
jgi:hypothetical protein